MNHKILVHVRPVITKSDYKETLARIEVLMDLSQKTKKEAAELDILATLVERYEEEHYPINPPDPIEAIKFRMEQMGLSQTNLAEILGSKHRASEYLNRKLPLSIQAIRKIKAALNIPGYILIQEFDSTLRI